jgi:hypothetical protein
MQLGADQALRRQSRVGKPGSLSRHRALGYDHCDSSDSGHRMLRVTDEGLITARGNV